MAKKDEKILNAVEGVMNGSLADNIKSKMKYALNGAALGAFIGLIYAGITGKSKVVYVAGGAAIFGASGYLLAPKKD